MLALGELQQLVRRTTEKSIAKGEAVFNEGDPADSVWVLYKGRIQVFKHTSGNRPFALESLGSGELFGTLCRLGGDDRFYPCTAIAAESTVTLRIPEDLFLEYYKENPGFIRDVCSLCSERLKDVQGLRCVGQEPVAVRMASTLLCLHRVHGNTLPFTKREISELVGVALETTFRTLAEFQKKGYLTSLRGKIQIKKPMEIKTFIDKA
jgi:CRP-like cAMP-binding protein